MSDKCDGCGKELEDEDIIFEADCDCGCRTRMSVELYDSDPLMVGISVKGEDNSFRLWGWSPRRTARARVWAARKEAWAILMNRPEWHEVVLRSEEVSALVRALVVNQSAVPGGRRPVGQRECDQRGFVPGSGSSM